MEESVICQMCREPIWNFLCIDCIGDNVSKWIPKALSQAFTGFHSNISKHFHTATGNFEPCVSCDLLNETPICPYCYTHEVYHWLNSNDSNLSGKFNKMFFFYPFEGSEFIRSDTLPITESENKRHPDGICDRCGEYADELSIEDKESICETCNC